MKKIITGMAVAVFFLSACKTSPGTEVKGIDSAALKLEKNKQTAINSDLAFNKKDIDGIFKDCTPDYVEYGNGESKPMKLDSIKANIKNLFVGFPDFKVENLHAIAAGDTVIIIADWSGTFKNQFMKMKPTGKAYKAPDADIFTFNKDGKITSHKSIQSDETYFMQLGIPMPPKKK